MTSKNIGFYKHKSLNLGEDEIRVLEIRPRHDESEQLHCSLRHISLVEAKNAEPDSQRTPFHAVSYTWGLPSPTETIFINEEPFVVRKNLYDFLATASLLRIFKRRLLWIDQICIDQSNGRERNHQVTLMSQIYRYAAKVLIWLGNGFDGSDALMDMATAHEERGKLDAPVASYRQLRPLWAQLASLPYWRRLWVCQEIVLAQDICIVVGTRMMRWDSFQYHWLEYCHYYFERLKQETAQDWERVQQLVETREEWWSTTTIVTQGFDWKAAMKLARGTESFERLDRIYGMNGLVPKEQAIDVDYTRSPKELFLIVSEARRENYDRMRFGYTKSQHSFLMALRADLDLKLEISDEDIQKLADIKPRRRV